jgi:glycosyltransferase involved in cell wall biosynthesis
VVAQVRPIKRLDVLIEAVNILAKEYSLDRFKVLIVGGDYPNRKSRKLGQVLRQRVADYGLADRIRFLEGRSDIEHIYAISDLAGLTSDSEGTPLSLVEAAAMGLPLFGSRAGGIPEIVRHDYNGRLFEAGDYRALAGVLRSLIEEQSTRRQFGQHSRELALKKYDLEKNVKTLREIYPAGILVEKGEALDEA